MSMAVNDEQNLLYNCRNSVEDDFPSLPGSLSSYDKPNPLLIAAGVGRENQEDDEDDHNTLFYCIGSNETPNNAMMPDKLPGAD